MPNTTPTTSTSSLNAGQVITRAYRMLGVLPSGGTPTADQMAQGILALNFMLKRWQADGTNLWRQEVLPVTFGSGQGGPTNPILVDPPFITLEFATWVQSPEPNLYERPLGIVSYIDYQSYPNKMSPGSPSTIMFDKQEDVSKLFLFPVPQNGGTINITITRSVLDVTQASDTLDFPIEWTEALYYNLADRLMEDEGVSMNDPSTAQRITERAAAFYQDLLDYDRPNSIWARPYGKPGYGRAWQRY